MRHREGILIAVLVLLVTAPTKGEGQVGDLTEGAIAEATDLALPSVPAFVLLDVNPSTVARPGFVEDFKLDLIIREGGLAPDLAIEAMPLWVLLFDEIDQPQYERLPKLYRALSTLSLSVATADKDSMQQLAWSAKVSVLREDPLLDDGYRARISEALEISDREFELAKQLEDSLAVAETDEERAAVIARYTIEVEKIEQRATEEILRIVEEKKREDWNATAVDLAVGQLYNYDGDRLESLRFDEKGTSIWVTTATGLRSRNWLLSGQAKWSDLGDTWDNSYGANIRYGGPNLNIFAEFVYERTEETIDKRTIAYGGEYRFGDTKAFEFGLRTEYDSDFEIDHLIPIVKLNWKLARQTLSELLGLP
jgi:hypothetical protein